MRKRTPGKQNCGCEFAALVERMKTHYSKFHAKTAQDDATAPKQRKMEPFVVKTSKSQQEQFESMDRIRYPETSVAKYGSLEFFR